MRKEEEGSKTVRTLALLPHRLIFIGVAGISSNPALDEEPKNATNQ